MSMQGRTNSESSKAGTAAQTENGGTAEEKMSRTATQNTNTQQEKVSENVVQQVNRLFHTLYCVERGLSLPMQSDDLN